MRTICIFTVALFSCVPALGLAQESSPSPSSSPSPAPAVSPAAKPAHATMKLPKGWLRVQGDSVATMIYRSPSASQDIRIAPIGHDASFTGDEGVKKVREILARFPFPKADVTTITVCGGTQAAILATAQDGHGQTLMEQVTVMGDTSGAIITYEINDAHPNPEAESAIRSVCIP